ncbi:glycoside hydrolase family 2 TIM barrel-domain containing protein [Glycomyces xiaoerkulensis]|uniref:glycoside hydrolase family 2 TIM barrel-domain containing protein n=1 Tax=Glycomyces xiaoerkulensis TaxID=2038139 RepID=UPI000C265969|nr:glycoside hydrolase family 2 TIM barrel-domain containing protein [Glycomyces xiaoerkulensis]
MVRRFIQHERREVRDLDGVWDFAFLGDVDPDRVDPGSIVFDDVMAVPGCFDATPGHAGGRGLVAYRTRMRVTDPGRYRLVFDGVHHWCRVYWDRSPVREHAGGFTRFFAEVEDAEAGWAEVVVLVDNRFDDSRSPLHLDYFDWYHFGGITRGVELHRLGEVRIDGLRVLTEDVEARRVALAVDYSATEPARGVRLTVECGGRTVVDGSVDVEASGRIERSFELPGAEPWSPSSPALHLVSVRLGEDDMVERFGLRRVGVEGARLAVNGEPLTLRGVNRHESHPQFGHAQPPGLLVADLEQIRDLGCNFVRGSHYPQDPLFLDLCDELGILVWSESIGWQYPAERLTDPSFIAAQLAHIDEMVAAAVNHPSIIMWGVLNESPSHEPENRPAYEKLLRELRVLDPSRPVTYASNHVYEDLSLDLVDVVAVNCYPGWYEGGLADIPGELDRIAAHVDGSGHEDKPLIISEIGAGAVPGWRDAHHGMWTEEYQAELLRTVIEHLDEGQDRISGLSIWVLGDFRTTDAKDMLLGRPRSMNDKGVLDEYRRPKQAYGAVRGLFARER